MTAGQEGALSKRQSPGFVFVSIWRARLFALAMSLLLYSCTVLPPNPDRTRFVLLTPETPASSTHDKPEAMPDAGMVAIGLGPVNLPAYLDRQELVIRTSANGFELSETNRWAESLGESFCHVLAADLSQRLDNVAIIEYPWNPGTRMDYTVRVKIQNFEADANQTASLSADWEMGSPHGDRTITRRVAQIRRSLNSLNGDVVAAALSDDVAELAGQIASMIVQAQQQRMARDSH
jgi:uncharacterized lipoprotein YmbA